MRALWMAATLVLMASACGSSPAPSPPASGRPPPALLRVEAPAGADVHVDGVFVGIAPLASAVAAEPGVRRVEVTMNGHEPFRRDVRVERAKETPLEVDLDETVQRKVAWSLIGTGAASVSAAVVLGVLSVVEHRESRDLRDRADGDLEGEEKQAYDDAVAARDAYRLGSGIAAGVGLTAFVVGAVLHGFDAPPAPREMTVSPHVGPDGARATFSLRF